MNQYEVPGWQPQQDIVTRFSDKTADKRTPEQLNQMLAEMRAVANKYGFDLSQWGVSSAFARYYRSIMSHRE